MTHHPATRTDITCRNCGLLAPLDFCGSCGQETRLHPPTLGEFVHEFVGHYVALEGALWRTLGLLLARPGRLTREYLAGRRRRYVLPLRLYLTASFLFFIVLRLMPSPLDQKTDADIRTVSPSVAASAPGAIASGVVVLGASDRALRPIDCGGPGEPACDRVAGYVNRVGERFGRNPLAVMKNLRTQMLGAAPYAAFLLLPVFAGIVALAYRSRRMTYGEHVVFSLHLHAFWFLALLLLVLLPDAVGDVLWLAMPVYTVWAMHEVYRGGWAATVLRAVPMGIAYGLLLMLATLGLVLLFLSKA